MRFRDGSDKGTKWNFVQISETMRRRLRVRGITGKSKFSEAERGETGEGQSQEHAHQLLWHQADCSQRISPGGPNSEFRVLLWRIMASAWKCAKTSPRTLVSEEPAAASRQPPVSHFWPRTTSLLSPAPSTSLCFSPGSWVGSKVGSDDMEKYISWPYSVNWVREWTIPTERPPLVGEVSANVFG
jgi:hypothetical protein